MLTAHPTLLIGPSDWQPERMPKQEFLQRIEALWRMAPSASHAIVFGSPAHHAELAWLTNLVPKLEPAAAVLARTGEHRLFVGGGANMLGAARPLSFITELAPLNGFGAALKQIAATSPALLIGGGYMAATLHQTIGDAFAGGTPPLDATARVWTLMRRKSPAELNAIREACAALAAAMSAMDRAQRSSAGVTDVVLKGERAANEASAQDVRTLFSVNGGRTLAPFITPIRDAVNPLQVYMAVRRFNYWAEGFALLSSQSHPAVKKAAAVLRSTLGAIKAGTRADDVARLIAGAVAPYRLHPVTARPVNAIGLALEEPPHTDVPGVFEAGEVYSLKVGLTDGGSEHAIVSAMIAVNDGGSDVLWQTGGAAV